MGITVDVPKNLIIVTVHYVNFETPRQPLEGPICGCKSGVTTINGSIEFPPLLRSTRMKTQLTEGRQRLPIC